ncbi:MAG: LCP family protein [Defluviitaleaceae bacterium]|nr:LCP family protein [Defluviitaleaceae bacterium]
MKKKSPLFKFAVILLAILIPAGVIIGVGYHMLNNALRSNLTDDQIAARNAMFELIRNLPDHRLTIADTDDIENLNLPTLTNVMILGIDFDGQTRRADTIIIASYDAETNEIALLSIPRDLRITWDEHVRYLIDNHTNPRELPSHSVRFTNGDYRVSIQNNNVNVNAIWHFLGPAYGVPITQAQIERMLGLPRIHYYIVLEMDGFIEIIDEVGGVYFNVPRRMYHVHAPDQFGIYLNIDLHPGYQLLTGQQALDLVRYRGTPRADLDRIEVQRDFLEYVIPQLLSLDNIFLNLFSYITAVSNYMETNATIQDIWNYARQIREHDNELTFRSYTLPIILATNGGHVYVNPGPANNLIQSIFFSHTIIDEMPIDTLPNAEADENNEDNNDE